MRISDWSSDVCSSDLGFQAALASLGYAVQDNWNEIVALMSFLGENLVKLGRTIVQPRRLRITAPVHHMEQVGLAAVPLVALLTYLGIGRASGRESVCQYV